MKKDKFFEFWGKWSQEWYKSIDVVYGTEPVSDLCKIKSGYECVLFKRYKIIKEIVRKSYFPPSGCCDKTNLFSRYKRAAIIAYAINGSSPLVYKRPEDKDNLNQRFLKQQLAFYVAIGSIIQDFPEQEVKQLGAKGDIFDFDSLGKLDEDKGQDSFLISVYKDLYYSEVYKNYNVLTMANVFGLLTEKSSRLNTLKPYQAKGS